MLEDRLTPTVPVVTMVMPANGPTVGGNTVIIYGQNFTNAEGVDFSSNCAAPSFTVVSDTEIDAIAPAFAAGTIDIFITNSDGRSDATAADQYTYTTPPPNLPTVTMVMPSSGPTTGGTTVQIYGQNLTNADAVMFGGQAAQSFTPVSDTEVDAVAPSSAAGMVDITVSTADGTSATSSADEYTYTAPPPNLPTVTMVMPNSGPTSGGNTVIIYGQNLTNADAVDFGGAGAVSFTPVSDTEVDAVAPPGAAGTVDVIVTTGAGGPSAPNSSDQYTYTTAAPSLPVITMVMPSSGPTTGGTTVQIYGQNFTNADAAMFGGQAAQSITDVSDTEVDAVAPPGMAGTVDVTVSTAAGMSATGSADLYTYTDSTTGVPSVSMVTPDSAPTSGGASVTIYGQGFTGATLVSFGGVSGTNLTVVSDSQINVAAPAESAGTVDVTVSNSDGISSTGPQDQFTYYNSVAVTGVSPNQGPLAGGQTVVITGSGFTGASAVFFGTAWVMPTVDSDTQITATTPVSTMPGTVDVIVQTMYETSAASTADQYTFEPGPNQLIWQGNLWAVAGDNITLAPTAFYAAGDSVSFSASGLPPGVSVDTATGVISGTISYGADMGSPYLATIAVNDTTLGIADQASFSWTVDAPQVVVTQPDDQQSVVGTQAQLQIGAISSDGQALTFSATGLPAGLAIDNQSGIISGTIAGNAASNVPYTVTVIASNQVAGISQSARFYWSVGNLVLKNPGYQQNMVGDQVGLQPTVVYAGSGSLAYTATSLPPGLTIDPGTGLLSGTIDGTADTTNPYLTTITVTDGTVTSSASFQWTVFAQGQDQQRTAIFTIPLTSAYLAVLGNATAPGPIGFIIEFSQQNIPGVGNVMNAVTRGMVDPPPILRTIVLPPGSRMQISAANSAAINAWMQTSVRFLRSMGNVNQAGSMEQTRQRFLQFCRDNRFPTQ